MNEPSAGVLHGSTRVAASFCLATYLFVWPAADLVAGDWPQWGYDAGGGAATGDELPEDLSLRWVRQLPQPRPAWPSSQPSLQFDLSYRPVAAGGLLFVPSMVTDSVTAYDLQTGRERWRFTTDGPVRLAPVAGGDAVYFGSDDGHLYCVDAADGTLRWRFRGGPADRKVLGNDRLISTWPIRGGPVLLDETVYFTSGIWSFMGIFVHAVDAQTGKVVWTNSGAGSTYTVQPHNSPAFGGFIPRGQLAANEAGLVAPGGRTPPACYDLATGELRHFLWTGKGGRGLHLSVRGDWFFVGGKACGIADGKPVLSTPVVVHDAEALYSVDQDRLVAQTQQIQEQTVQRVNRRGKKVTAKRRRLRQLWALPLAEGTPKRLFLKAGSKFYLGEEGRVAAIRPDPDSGETELAWKGAFEGNPWTILAAAERLFVVTTEGRIYCFGSGDGRPQTYDLPGAGQTGEAALPGSNAPPPQSALLAEASRVGEGYCLVFGSGDGRLLDELLGTTRLKLIVIDPEVTNVSTLRRRMQDRGVYGTRLAAHLGSGATYPLPPYLASLIVCRGPVSAEADGGVSLVKAVFAALRPYGGRAYLPVEAGKLRGVAEEARLANARVKALGSGGSLLIRQGPLPGAADWTHNYADAASSVVSQDSRVRPPLGLLWFGGPPNDEVLPRHGHGPAPQVAAGRLFIEGRHMLRATDVYTGRLLWQKEIPDLGKFHDNTSHQPGAGEIGSNYVSLPESVYVAYGDRILKLDAASGRLADQFKLAAGPGGSRPRWGFIAAWKDLLIATSTPVALRTASDSTREVDLGGLKPLMKPHGVWRYLAGEDPHGDWTAVDYEAGRWKSGEAGFGYGDDDDRTLLEKMQGRYTRVYIRKHFDGKTAADAESMALVINYDDGFIAYLNGKEVARAAVKRGRGPKATGIGGHEAGKYEKFAIEGFRRLLRPGRNVIAVEGHNTDIASSDFSLDPYLVIKPRDGAVAAKPEKPKPPTISELLIPAEFSSASRRLVVLDRHTGKTLWDREAKYGFRHNNISIGADKLFCIDGMSRAKQQILKRHGRDAEDYTPRLAALNVRTGEEIWSTGENVFGTFLNYSAERDVLLQAGSAARDRARDESDTGMIAYRGGDGSVIWQNLELKHSGPCILHDETIITQGPGGGPAYDLLTGKPKLRKHPLTAEPLPWTFARNYGCNTAIASRHLLTFRSAAAGFFDLTNDGGTGNLGGFKTGCTSNLIAAGGVLNAPEYTRTCTCNYQNQTSLAMVHDPQAELWTFNAVDWDGRPVRRLGLNLGAPGDRQAGGTLWLDCPSQGGPSPDLPVELAPKQPSWFRYHSSHVRADPNSRQLAWVAASGAIGLRTLCVRLSRDEQQPAKPRLYTVRLHFAEVEDIEPGRRVFNVALQDREVLTGFDISAQSGGNRRAVVRQFKGIEVAGELKVSLTPAPNAASAAPILCGIEVVAEGW